MYKFIKNEEGKTICRTLEMTGAVATLCSAVVALFYYIKENKKSK